MPNEFEADGITYTGPHRPGRYDTEVFVRPLFEVMNDNCSGMYCLCDGHDDYTLVHFAEYPRGATWKSIMHIGR